MPRPVACLALALWTAAFGVAALTPTVAAQEDMQEDRIVPLDESALETGDDYYYLDGAEQASDEQFVYSPTSHAVASKNCDRWRLGLSGGWQERETVHEVGDPQTFIVFDSGFLVNAQLGYRFDVFRIEAEYSFMNNDVDRAGAGGADTPAAGNVNLKALMLNIYHDFQLFDLLWEPYVGAGLGIYQSELNSLYPDFFDQFGAPFQGVAVNATSNMPLAYQFRGGVSRPIGRRTEFFTGYRFFKGEELEFSSAPFATFAPTFHPDGAEVHSLELGLRVRF